MNINTLHLLTIFMSYASYILHYALHILYTIRIFYTIYYTYTILYTIRIFYTILYTIHNPYCTCMLQVKYQLGHIRETRIRPTTTCNLYLEPGERCKNDQ